MGKLTTPPAVRPLTGLLAGQTELLQTVGRELALCFGPFKQISEPVRFIQTDYYAREMGTDLWRQFLVFERLQAPEELAAWKLAANELEQRLSLGSQGRRVNIDPGYLAPGKLVLASTKDYAHRLYLREGIYAEITLKIQDGRFHAWEWTYPDYIEAIPFFNQAYADYLREITPNRK